MIKQRYLIVLSMVMAIAISVYGYAQNPQSRPQSDQQRSDTNKDRSGQSTLDSSDRRFVMEAAESGRSEVRMGQLALQRATNDQVKQFAQKMIDDHTKANQELMELASSKGITLPSDSNMSSMQSATGGQTQSATGGQTRSTTGGQTQPATGGQTQPTTGGQTSDQTANKNRGQDSSMEARFSRYSGAEFDREYMKQQLKDHDKAIELFQKQSTQGKDPQLKDWAAKTLPKLREHQAEARTIASAVGASSKSDRSSNR